MEITDDAEGVAHQIAARLNSTAAEVLASPYAWIGTVREIEAAMADHQHRWGITRYVIREPQVPAADRILTHLSHSAQPGLTKPA